MSNLRREYRHRGLTRVELDPNPMEQFRSWFDEMVKLNPLDANAMCFSSVDSNNQPSSRILLLKEYNDEGFTFFTNYNSKKGRDLEGNPKASMLFYWSPLERQVRIQGAVVKVEAELSDEYFESRPRASQIGALISKQSEEVYQRAELEDKYRELEDKVGEESIARPAYWGGYQLVPHYFEFWQGRENRVHDRFTYRRSGDKWNVTRLQP